MKYLISVPICIFFMAIFFSSCKEEPEPSRNPGTGHVSFKFLHFADGVPLFMDSMIYVNSAGNAYEVNELMYFVSDFRLSGSDGSKTVIEDPEDIHYVNIDMPSTLSWEVMDDIPAGIYDSITFIFGITEEKNKPGLFLDFPESKMLWPETLGGGYHYMMMNGRWLDPDDTVRVFNLHLGIGQLYKSNVVQWDSIYAYVQNYFSVKLPGSEFTILKDSTTEIEIIMNIDSWFKTPHDFDFNEWGGHIMQNQPAMEAVKENGADVFSIGEIR